MGGQSSVELAVHEKWSVLHVNSKKCNLHGFETLLRVCDAIDQIGTHSPADPIFGSCVSYSTQVNERIPNQAHSAGPEKVPTKPTTEPTLLYLV